ncbi:MAG: ATP-binding protein [Candidatus Polarisedimenticolaceae bacterium]|nr:ATP-binding protein [Candidatus Polarisedimenticolaceae bacterium]
MFQSFWTTTRWALVPMVVGSVIVATLLPTWRWDYELFHVLIEGGGALMGFGLALIVAGMIHKERLETNYIWLIACFLSMGTLDMTHSLMPPGQTFVWLHSTATFIGGLFAALIWLPNAISNRFFNRPAISTIWLLAIAFSLWSVLWPEATPAMLDEQMHFTVSAKFFNIVGGLGFLITWLYFAREYHYHHHPESFYFSNQFCLFGLAGLLFESSALWDGNWWLWHMLRAFAYVLLMLHFGSMYWRDIAELAKLNHELENRVDKRTNALKTALIDLQQTQSQLIQTDKLASVGTLATGIAHELRQPLMVNRLTIEELLTILEDGDLELEDLPPYLQKMLGYCTRMDKIINHLRCYARDGEMTGMERTSLPKALENSFTLLGAQLRSRGIKITQTVAEEIPCIRGNANQLEQVLINLLSNAKDTLKKVEEPAIKISINSIDDNVVLNLSDNGPGVPEAIKPTIFDPFFTTKEIGKGTGLGLSISQGIIADHGGTIAVTDAEGGGAQFTITLPIYS